MNAFPTIIFGPYLCNVIKEQYSLGGTCLRLISDDGGMPIAIATVFIKGVDLEEDEVCIKDYSENTGMLACLVANGIVEDTGRVANSGHVEVHIVKVLI